MITCIIIEDDQPSCELLLTLIAENPEDIKVLGVASTVTKGIELINQTNPQLVFLAAELTHENGFILFNAFSNPNFEVIILSAGIDYALTAIKHMAVDYLIKPYKSLDISAAIVRFNKRRNVFSIKPDVKKIIDKLKYGSSFNEKIAVPTLDGFLVVRHNDILYCQASENYTYLNTIENKSILITKTLKTIEELLPANSFFRIHKSILLNINYIKSLSRKDGFVVTLENDLQFEVATRRQEDFINFILRKKTELDKNKEYQEKES